MCRVCVVKSLKKAKKQNNFYQKFFIPLAVLFVAGVCITSVLFVQNRLPKCHFLKRCESHLQICPHVVDATCISTYANSVSFLL